MGPMRSDQKVRWQETRSNGRVSRSSSTRSKSWCLRSRTPKAEHVNPVSPPGKARTRSSLPDRRFGEMARVVPVRHESSRASRPRGTPMGVRDRMLEEANAGL